MSDEYGIYYDAKCQEARAKYPERFEDEEPKDEPEDRDVTPKEREMMLEMARIVKLNCLK